MQSGLKFRVTVQLGFATETPNLRDDKLHVPGVIWFRDLRQVSITKKKNTLDHVATREQKQSN